MERTRSLKRLLIGVSAFILVFFILFSLLPMSGSGLNENIENTAIITEASIRETAEGYLFDINFTEPTNKGEVVKTNSIIDAYVQYLYEILNTYDYRTEEYKIVYSVLGAEIDRVNAIKTHNEEIYEEFEHQRQVKLEARKWTEYPEAMFIWSYMKSKFGWSDETCAGIMGNMMAEVGGGTLSGLRNWGSCGSSL